MTKKKIRRDELTGFVSWFRYEQAKRSPGVTNTAVVRTRTSTS
ncbi:MAG: hypothetical protein SGJ27_28425 [Candidatus Melainabacteria bacterium]|nr:hypothetical protein [Candidatus Melainabacteria bacterium]